MFLIIVGGYVKSEQKDVGGRVMQWFITPVTDPNITIVVELGKIIHIRTYRKFNNFRQKFRFFNPSTFWLD